MTARAVRKTLRSLADPAIAAHARRFFKTGKGEYGAGDRFLGIRVPVLRRIVKDCRDLALPETLPLLHSAFHEERLFALLLLVDRFRRGAAAERAAIYRLYLAHTDCVNNWDLVDASAPYIVGAYLEDRDRRILSRLAVSASLWERRIAIIATLHLIRGNRFDDTLKIAEMLLQDGHDLIHKAVGWMLREVGKRDRKTAEAFLASHYRGMPRTMLRYAIERYPQEKRMAFLKGRI